MTPLVTLFVGAAVATGAYTLIDDDGTATATKTIVVEQPGPNAADIPGKNESATAAAVTQSPNATDIAGKNESATAAAITQSSGVELRGSKASSGGIPSPAAAEQLRQDPHGPGISLRNP